MKGLLQIEHMLVMFCGSYEGRRVHGLILNLRSTDKFKKHLQERKIGWATHVVLTPCARLRTAGSRSVRFNSPKAKSSCSLNLEAPWFFSDGWLAFAFPGRKEHTPSRISSDTVTFGGKDRVSRKKCVP